MTFGHKVVQHIDVFLGYLLKKDYINLNMIEV